MDLIYRYYAIVVLICLDNFEEELCDLTLNSGLVRHFSQYTPSFSTLLIIKNQIISFEKSLQMEIRTIHQNSVK